jgi:hypothetical protein
VKALLLLLVVGVVVNGCGGSDSKLERRVSKLEAENAALRGDLYGGHGYGNQGIKARALRAEWRVNQLAREVAILDQRTWANDKALWTGVTKAQYDVQCGPHPDPNCHVAAGFPGTVYTSGTPRRLFVTPWP